MFWNKDIFMDTSSARKRALLLLIITLPIALVMKHYTGPGMWWLNNWGASIGYELFFILVFFILFPRRSAVIPIAVLVCIATCGLEILQLYKPPLLEIIRDNYLGRALIGNHFAWADFPAYPIGCALGWFLLTTVAAPKSSMGTN
jgi:hypothetical protein